MYVYIYIYDLYTFIYTYIHIVCVFVCRHVYSHYGCLNVPWLCQGQTHGSAGWLGPGSLEHRLCRQPLHCTSSRLSLKDIKDLKDLKGSKLWLPQLYIYIHVHRCMQRCMCTNVRPKELHSSFDIQQIYSNSKRTSKFKLVPTTF